MKIIAKKLYFFKVNLKNVNNNLILIIYNIFCKETNVYQRIE